jgi:tRNA modification GTPase
MAATDTIYALASARGRAGVAVIRISGPQSDAALIALGVSTLPQPRQTSVQRLVDPQDHTVLDEALILRFAEGASFTGEASAEIHCHGGPAVVSALLNCLSRLPALRLADPGEFTRRAFDNGRLDLVQIEGLSDLIASETEAQRRAAIRQSDGSLGQMIRTWSSALTQSCALLEATIDFADEDIPDDTYDAVTDKVFHVKHAIESLLANAIFSERFRDGWRIALIGAPNAGKSSLINALARRDIAITSPIAGTTRDAIEVALDLKGYPVTLIDTAGMRDTEDAIETVGVARALKSAETADMRIALAAHDAPLTEDVCALLQDHDLMVWNKSDQAQNDAMPLSVSAKSGTGLDALIQQIADRLDFADPANASALLRDRHDAALRDSLAALDRFAALAQDPRSTVREAPEIAAEHLRLARAALGTITGDVGVERLLDVIFSEFCLGK